MRAIVCVVISVAVLTGCGASGARIGCQGLPTAKHSTSFLVLFGRASDLTKRSVCAHFGTPTSIKQLPGGQEDWRYGTATITFRGAHAIR